MNQSMKGIYNMENTTHTVNFVDSLNKIAMDEMYHQADDHSRNPHASCLVNLKPIPYLVGVLCSRWRYYNATLGPRNKESSRIRAE